jgi:hypothetical protein
MPDVWKSAFEKTQGSPEGRGQRLRNKGKIKKGSGPKRKQDEPWKQLELKIR